MRKNKICGTVINCLLVVAGIGTTYQAMAQNAATPSASSKYMKMAPVDQYLMADRNAEIALARSAAPESISRDAEVQLLGPHGFETALKGKNGFVCIVGRSFTSSPDFWNPRVRVPMCFNPAGARSYLVRVTKETAWVLAGQTPEQLTKSIIAGLGKELPVMEPGAMCYMMGKQGYAGDHLPHWGPHLMFFYSQTEPGFWGANQSGSPIIAVADPDEKLTQFVIAAQQWSDGTSYRGPAVKHKHN